jgi:CSLREA domain-containing protein
MRTKLASATVVVGVALALAPTAGAFEFRVNQVTDGPPGVCDLEHCTLREAILAANASPENDAIRFVLGPGARTIRPTSQLPAITGAGTTIDGLTPGVEGPPVIELSGELIEVDASGLVVGDPDVPTTDVTIRGLVINRFGFDAIRIGSGAARTHVEGNWLGLDASGTIAAPNRGYGVLVWESADDTVIGGGSPAQRNVISGNGTGGGFSGVGVFSEGATGNSVIGNWIGLAANGVSPVGNEAAGVVFNDTPDGTVESNVIAGNKLHGVLLFAAADTEVDSNTIGLDTEDAPEGNGGAGVYLLAGGNVITPGNVISANGGGGIVVESGSGNQLHENQIDGNTGLGIDILPAGVTPNDPPGDEDTGPNDLQNFPVLSSATALPGGTQVQGEIFTGPTGDYRIDFYASATCDASGNGEGARWLGATSVATNVDGFAAIDATVSVGVTSGEAVTATATAPNGSTSEFSACVTVGGGEPSGTFTVNSANNVIDAAGCDATHCSLNEAINAANAATGPNTIRFAVGTGPITIQPALPLPVISGPTVLDATTQPGFSGRPIVFVDGINAGANATGFFVTGGQTTIRGFVLSRWNGTGITLNIGGGNTVENNFIGVDPTGEVDFGNGIGGIQLANSDDNVIRGNVISGNGSTDTPNVGGISVFATGANETSDRNTITGNLIGTDVDGVTAIPNANTGIVMSGTGNTVGGAGTAQNRIAFNGSHGIQVDGAAGGNTLGPNQIHDNGGLGIELGTDGVTPNDAAPDADGGPNGLQNTPELTSALLSDISVRVTGTLTSGFAAAYRIDLSASATCDASGSGEGARFLGSVNATTNAQGVAQFDTGATLTAPVAGGEAITATATAADGSTSEFSRCEIVGGGAALEPLTSASECPTTADDGTVIHFENDGTAGVPVAERYASLGVHFADTEAQSPIIRSDELRPTPSPPSSLFNQTDAPEAGSGGIPLTISFDRGQRVVGFYLVGLDAPPLTATLRAFDSDNGEIGVVTTTTSVDSRTVFFGARAAAADIRSIELDYGAAARSEEIDDLCFAATDPEDGEGSADPSIVLTSDRRVLPVAAQLVPLSAVPGSQLPAYSGSPGTGPVGSIPIGSVPIGSVPIGSVPIGSVPIGSVPIASVPIASVPIGSVPIGSVGLAGVPIGSVGLDGIQLSALPIDWAELLGTNVPIQSLTLADVYANPTWRAKFEALTIAQSGLTQSPLGSLTFPAILLGKATLSQIPPPGASSWCAALQNAGGSCAGLNTATNTVAGIGIAGAPIGSVPIGSVPIASVPIASVPIGSVPIASVDLEAARLAGIRLSAITNPNTVVDCARISCTAGTLGGAAALTPSAIRPGATLAQLAGAFGNQTINDIIIGILPRSALAWESFPLDGLQLYAGTGDEVLYTLSFDLTCPLGAFSANVRLPTGYIIKRGTTRVRYGTGTAIDGPDPVTNAKTGARWTSLPGTPCPAGTTDRRVNIDFRAVGGYTLGVHTSDATVTEGGVTRTATDEAPVTTRQNWESNDDPATAPTLAPDRLGIVHVASSGDEEVFKVAIPPTPGTRTTFYLSHIAEDADFDLVVQQPAATTLQSAPIASVPIASVPIEDHGSDFSNQDTAIPPETLADIPIGSVPIGSVPIASVSANRGSADETAEVVATGETGFYTVTIRGYNGSHSDLPAVLRVKVTPPAALPPCPARTFPNAAGTQGVLPAALPPGTKTIFLLNRSRLNRLYGQAAVDEMRTEALAMLGRPEIAGALLEVDGDAAVRNAYAAWDASPCDTEAANNVVRAINALVATYRAGAPQLRYVVILGTDEALPMARISDPTTISNETDEAADLEFTTSNLTKGNALHAAAARAKFLSDAPYGTLAQIPWLGRQLYLPELAVGRLVETPVDIRRQLKTYVDANGTLTAASALTTGYDFLTDGATEVDTQLSAFAGSANRLLDDTWTATTLKPLFTDKPIPDSVLSVNAHYSHWLLQPAAGSELVSTAALPALPADPLVEPAFARRVVFVMGCHSGLSVADSLLPGSTSQRLRDWAQSYGMQRAAVYVANTGFGYGDTESNALSERLMSIFAKRLREDRPIGESWVTALGDYFLGAGAYGVYDEKVLQEATFYGLPFWKFSGGTTPTPPTPPALTTDPVSGLQVASISMAPTLAEDTGPRGRFWRGPSGTVDIHYRPIQPRLDRDVTVPGQTAHGVIIKALATNDVGGVDPVTSLPTIDLSSHEPERNFRDTVFPASIVNLTRARGIGGVQRQSLVLTAGQYRPATPPGATGIERLVLSAAFEVAYSSSPDFSPPGIKLVNSTFGGGVATIVVETTEPVKRVAAIVNDTVSWRFVELTNVAGTNRWTATVTAANAVEVGAMAQDTAGNVGYSFNKGFNFTSVADTDGPEITIDTPGELQIFTLGAEARASYACSDPLGVASCVGTVPNNGLLDTSSVGTKTFTVRATDTGGRVTTETRQYEVRYGFSGFRPPVDNPPTINIANAGRTIPVKWQLRTASGGFIRSTAVVKKITVSVIDCANRPSDPLPDTPASGGSGLTYDTGGEQFQFNWVTQRSWAGTCRRLTIELDDGTKPYADFSFR